MLRSGTNLLKFSIDGTRCVNEQLATKRKRIAVAFNAQAFKLECGANSGKDVVALGS